MAFTEEQRQALQAKLRVRHVRSRVSNGTTIPYVEGWHVIAEANRIFGYDCWDRTTWSPDAYGARRSGVNPSAFILPRSASP